MERSKIAGKVILVTGGAGNIGSYIVDRIMLLKPEKCVVVDNLFNSDRSNIKKHSGEVDFYPLDISSESEVEYLFKKYNFDFVFHCASMLIQDSEALPVKSINTNIIGTFNIVNMSNKYGVKKICYSSSASVYGEPLTLPVEEDHPYQHKNFIYGWTKITAEMIFLSYAKMDWCGFRYYNVYSERMNRGAFYTQVFPIFYDAIKNGKEITMYGDGSQTMDLIHAEDIANANILGLESDVTGQFFNVGTGKSTSVFALANMMMFKMQKTTPIKYLDDDSQKVKHRRSGTKKIKEYLGFEPKITILEGLERYLKLMDNKNDN